MCFDKSKCVQQEGSAKQPSASKIKAIVIASVGHFFTPQTVVWCFSVYICVLLLGFSMRTENPLRQHLDHYWKVRLYIYSQTKESVLGGFTSPLG